MDVTIDRRVSEVPPVAQPQGWVQVWDGPSDGLSASASPTPATPVRSRQHDWAALILPASALLAAGFTWLQHRLILGEPAVPGLAYLLPSAVGLAVGALTTWLVVARRSAESRASIDSLTRIRNRAATELALASEVERAARYGGPFSVVVFDVDRFKGINDTYGHAAGDGVLLHLAETVSGIIRKTDAFGRWGGDEFVLVAPGIPVSGGRSLAEKIREAVAATPAPGGIPVTISVGVSHFVVGDSVQSVLRRADEALYEAKRAGRNRAATNRCLRTSGSHRVVTVEP